MILRQLLCGRALCALALVSGLSSALAEESKDVGAMVQTNCTKCHGDEIYTRADRKVTSLDGLNRQVGRCETALGLQWFDEDIADVASYLNDKFYKFDR